MYIGVHIQQKPLSNHQPNDTIVMTSIILDKAQSQGHTINMQVLFKLKNPFSQATKGGFTM